MVTLIQPHGHLRSRESSWYGHISIDSWLQHSCQDDVSGDDADNCQPHGLFLKMETLLIHQQRSQLNSSIVTPINAVSQ